MRRNLNAVAMLAGLMAMMHKPNSLSGITLDRPVKNKPKASLFKRYGQRIQLQYPDHYTNQQRGFTPAGSAKLNFYHTSLFIDSRHYQPGRGYIMAKKAIKAGKIYN